MSAQHAEGDAEHERWTADPDEMEQRRALAERVETTLSRNEQESSFSFFGDADRCEIITYRRSMVRALLKHEYAKINWLYEHPDESRGGRVDYPSEVPNAEALHRVEGISVSLPLGALSVKGSPRKEDKQSAIVSTPEEARAVASAFRGEDVDE